MNASRGALAAAAVLAAASGELLFVFGAGTGTAAAAGEGATTGDRSLRGWTPKRGFVECEVREVVYYGSSPGSDRTDDDDIVLHCVEPLEGLTSYEIDGLDEEERWDIRNAVRANGGSKKFAFNGAKLGARAQGRKRPGETVLKAVPHAIPLRSYRALDDDDGGEHARRIHGSHDYGDEEGERGGRRRLAQLGSRTAVVVRVSGTDGQVGATASELSDKVFGTRGDAVNLRERMAACSHGKFGIDRPPDDIFGLVDGVVEVDLEKTLSGAAAGDVKNDAATAAAAKIGPLSRYDFVMYVLPDVVDFGEGKHAWAYMPGTTSVYKDHYATYTWTQMHEVGHNLGLMHSGENGDAYADRTGFLGKGSNGAVETSSMCYNPQKMAFLGWFDDRMAQIDLNVPGSIFDGKLIGINDYGNAASDEYMVILKVIGPGQDWHLTYNRKEGINEGVQEKADTVTLVEGDAVRGRQSWLLGGLGPGQEKVVNDFEGTGQPLVIDVSGTGSDGLVDYALVTVSNMCSTDEHCDIRESCVRGSCGAGGVCSIVGVLLDCCGNGICEESAGERCSSATCPSDCCVANVALGKAVAQSSTAYGGVPERAVDGDTNGVWTGGSISHTVYGTQNWWTVDLGSDYLVNNVILYNRLDCCGHQLSNFDVFLLDSNPDVVMTHHHPGTAGEMAAISFNDDTRDGYMAHHVKIQLRGDGVLSLVEVEVYAAPSSCGNDLCDAVESCPACQSDCCTANLALGKAASQSSALHGGGPERAVDGDTNGDWSGGSVMHTGLDCPPWWKVDLGEDADVGVVKIYNRLDHGADRLHDFTVQVLDANEALVVASYYHAGTTGAVTKVEFERGSAGRFVKIVNGCGESLSLAEVEVFGHLVGTTSPTRSPESLAPTNDPSALPSNAPTSSPITSEPMANTPQPTTITSEPMDEPSASPSTVPAHHSMDKPSALPSGVPTSSSITSEPTDEPTASLSVSPSSYPTDVPSTSPSGVLTIFPIIPLSIQFVLVFSLAIYYECGNLQTARLMS